MLVGREAERRVIGRLIAGARVGSSGVLVITGEPGIGKTALVDDAVTLAAGMRVLRARGADAEREVPFGGLLQLLRPAVGELERIPAPQRHALAAALALGEGTPGDRFAVGAATLSVICRYAEAAPLALLVDDVHLLDPPSAEALLFAARRLLADPVALLELAGDLERLDRIPPGAPLPVPAVLVDAFAERAARLGPAARTALLVVAAEGGDLDTVAGACAGLGIEVAALAEAEHASLVRVVDGRVEFRHPLVRSAVYASADPVRRRAAHRAVAAALPGHEVDRRAWHLSESVLGTDPVRRGGAGRRRRACRRPRWPGRRRHRLRTGRAAHPGR